MLQQPDSLIDGVTGGEVPSHVTSERRGLVLRLVRGVDELLGGSGRSWSVQTPHLLLLMLLLREDSLLLGDESWLVVAQRGGGWADIL